MQNFQSKSIEAQSQELDKKRPRADDSHGIKIYRVEGRDTVIDVVMITHISTLEGGNNSKFRSHCPSRYTA